MRNYPILKSKRGSIVVEAAIILPLLLMLLLFLILLIKLALVQMALQSTAYESVKYLAANLNPYATDEDAKASSSSDRIIDTSQTEREPSAVRQRIASVVHSYAKHTLLDLRNLQIEEAGLPNFDTKKQDAVRIQLKYKMPVGIPFINSSLELHETAMERAWVGDEFTYTDVHIDHISPSPVKRGNRILISATVPANTTAEIKVFYKSGTSVARGLTPKISDIQGKVTWEWLVSGNTTPGEWTVQISVNGESQSATFQVLP